MKRILTFFLFAAPLFAFAQRSATAVVEAEKRFAAYSVQHGTKAAFLQFADSNGIVFERGKAVNAIEAWNKREARPGVLNWYPIYGWMAASGDLGFTTGPWTFQPKSTSDSVVARGQYNTVWHKSATGEWKFLLDMGINKTPSFETVAFSFPEKNIAFTPGTSEELLKTEEAFVQRTSDPAQRVSGYAGAISPQAFLLNRNEHLPVTTQNDLATMVRAMPQTISYRQEGSGMAASGDLGYVYGTAIINGKEDSYLRIWRREGKSWKLVLEVLQY